MRLLKKDLVLANRLSFELVDTRTIEDRRLDIETKIKNRIEIFSKYHTSPGYLMMDMRDISGIISEHLKITKDKYGEVSLNLLMLNEVLIIHNERILKTTRVKARKLCTYIIARSFKILILISKLHDDMLLDFGNDLEKLGLLISKNDYLIKTAIQNGFDVNWLLDINIPHDIEKIHKHIRAQGYLTGRVYLNAPNYGTK